MTEPDGRESASTSLAGSPTEELTATARLCPFLLADGGWRADAPAREHRCTALRPPTRLATEKQRRLCLTADHAACPTFLAAYEERAGRAAPGGAPAGRAAPGGAPVGRPIAMTAPVVVERSRALLSFDSSPGRRRWGQLGLVLLMLVALVAVVVARSDGDGTPAAGGVESPGPPSSETPGASTEATTGPTPGSSATSSGGSAAPSASSNTTPRPAKTPPVATPPAAGAGTTYTVKRGDTLSSIAARFGTTVAAIQKRNGIADPSLIHVGEVLEIP